MDGIAHRKWGTGPMEFDRIFRKFGYVGTRAIKHEFYAMASFSRNVSNDQEPVTANLPL